MTGGLSAEDRTMIKSMFDTLVEKKMTGEDAPRRAMYSDDIVQMIPQLAEPVRGINDMVIDPEIPLTFDLTIEDIDGSGNFAYARTSIRMTYAGAGDSIETYGAMNLLILNKQPDGKWLITNDIFTFETLENEEAS
jgi:ketosteroid isomerase-like protein